MKIQQNEDGSGEIIFNEEEKKIIAEKGRFLMPPKFLKHFTNILFKLVVDVNEKLPNNIQKEKT